jgi:hypothetical protein
MHIMALGRTLSGDLLFPPVHENDFVDGLLGSLEQNARRVQDLTRATSEAVAFRGEVERRAHDPGDPRSVGWTFLLNAADSRRADIERILAPLAEHRGMADPNRPLLFGGEGEEGWFDWLHDNYYELALTGEQVPQYVLIVGGPDQVPFPFQALLDTVAKVGRLDFDTLEDLQTYVDKLIRIETAPAPVVSAEAFLFAPDHGLPDPTYFSREYMVLPLAEHIEEELKLATRLAVGPAATKDKLIDGCAANPALVYTASHGLAPGGQSPDQQRRYNGAICCQHEGRLNLDAMFSADDIPPDEPFLEGAVFFQFACFGYGTPAQSDFAHWIGGVPQRYAPSDFVAALPKRLLAHPRGPLAFVGHLDTAFLHGFTDAADPHILDRWHSRMAPFVRAVDRLLGVEPCGLAMEDMNARYSVCNALITSVYDRQRRGSFEWTRDRRTRFVDNWILRGDSQNYLVFGDPAARLRIPSPDE